MHKRGKLRVVYLDAQTWVGCWLFSIFFEWGNIQRREVAQAASFKLLRLLLVEFKSNLWSLRSFKYHQRKWNTQIPRQIEHCSASMKHCICIQLFNKSKTLQVSFHAHGNFQFSLKSFFANSVSTYKTLTRHFLRSNSRRGVFLQASASFWR